MRTYLAGVHFVSRDHFIMFPFKGPYYLGVTHYSYGEGALAHSTAFSYLFERGAAIDLEAHLPSKGEARRGSTAKERDLEAHPSDG